MSPPSALRSVTFDFEKQTSCAILPMSCDSLTDFVISIISLSTSTALG